MQHSTPVVSLSKNVLKTALSAVLVVSLCPGFGAAGQAHAVTAAEKQAEAEEALANLNAMQETLDRLSVEYGEALFAQEEAESNRDAAEARLGEINGQISDLQTRLNSRAREMYRNGSSSFVEMLLGASTFEEFATSLDMFNKVNENDADMVQERKDLAVEAEEQAQVYTDQAQVAAEKAEEAAAAEEQAQATVAEMQATYDSLSEEAAQLLEEERAAQAAAEAARAAAEAEAAAAAAAASASSNAGASSNADASSDAGAASDSGSGDDSASSSDTSGDSISYEGGSDTVSRAQACLGAPYVWGGVGPNGYDCSGLVSYCLTGSHTRLGTTHTFMGWPQVSNPQPGDICVNWTHTGVYIGNGQMIHAATYGVGVITGPVQSGMIYVRYGG